MQSRTVGDVPTCLQSVSSEKPASVVPISTLRRPSSQRTAEPMDADLLISTLGSGSSACARLSIAQSENAGANPERAAEIVAREARRLLMQDAKSWPELKRKKLVTALVILAGGKDRSEPVMARVQGMLGHYGYSHKDPAVASIMVTDWMYSLRPYPFYAVESACRAWMEGKDRHKHPMPADIAEKAATRSIHFRALWSMVSETPLPF